jgi:predicted DNA-binding transcriptional regulator YafY
VTNVRGGRDDAPGKRDRGARLVRVGQLLQAAGERGTTVVEIARVVGTSVRTVYRDLKAIDTELDIRIWAENGRWGADPDAPLLQLRLTPSEAIGLFLSARLMARYADHYDPDLGGAFQKLSDALPPVLADHVGRTVLAMSELPRDAQLAQRVHDLTKAWASRRVVEFTYDGATYDPSRGSRQARVRPYLLEPSIATRALYLIGHDETRGELRTFKVARISRLAITPDTFEPDPDLEVERRLAAGWDMIADQPAVEVVLRFSSAVAARIRETRWHPSERIEPAPGGGLRWRATVSGTKEIVLWILSWGDDVEVLEPAALRTEVAATLARAAGRYAAGG